MSENSAKRVNGATGKSEGRLVTRALLREMPLPALDAEGDKDARGRVLVIGGSTSVPGAMSLAGVASLRAGAGKLQLATVRDAALPLGFSVPEALVVALPQRADGEIDGAELADSLDGHVESADAVLIGPGMMNDDSALAIIRLVVPRLGPDAVLVLDGAAAVALHADHAALAGLHGRAILTPHAGEMASMLGIDKADVTATPHEIALRAARSTGATIAFKGAHTFITNADGECLHFRGGSVGLGTSGSGDTLAGIVVGLAARGASPMTAALWGVWAHGMAGRVLSRRVATVGFLARELLAEVPAFVGRG